MRITGIDTETKDNGNILVIATENDCLTVNDINDDFTSDELFSWLTKHKHRHSICFTFNLRYDSQAILRYLPSDLYEELWNTGKAVWKDYKFTFIPKKFFAISRNKGAIRLYDIAQYYQGHNLESAAQQFLGEGKDDIDSSNMEYEWKTRREEVIRYCIRDAQLAAKLGRLSMQTIQKLGFNTTNPYSCGAISARYVIDNYPDYPKDIPDDVNAVAFLSYHGGIFETRKRGLFDDGYIYDYDINSAYPWIMHTLPNWRNGEFNRIDDPNDCDFGWFLAEFDCPYIPWDSGKAWKVEYEIENVGKIELESKNHQKFYPEGLRTQYITKHEYDWMRMNGYKVEYIDGWGWTQITDVFPSPFKWLRDFYYKRQEIKHDKERFAENWNMKILMNSLYGKTAQQVGKGKLTCFPYASYITAACRIALTDIVHQNEDKIINIATDGLLSTSKLDIGYLYPNKLGGWEENKYEKAIVVGNGILQLFKDDGTFITKARGITGRKDWNLFGEIQKNLDKTEIKFTKKRPIQLGEIIYHKKKLKPSDLNRFMEVSRRVDVNCDKSHNWDRQYKNFRDLLEHQSTGKPKLISQLQKM